MKVASGQNKVLNEPLNLYYLRQDITELDPPTSILIASKLQRFSFLGVYLLLNKKVYLFIPNG